MEEEEGRGEHMGCRHVCGDMSRTAHASVVEGRNELGVVFSRLLPRSTATCPSHCARGLTRGSGGRGGGRGRGSGASRRQREPVRSVWLSMTCRREQYGAS